jgi:hypothetical protein
MRAMSRILLQPAIWAVLLTPFPLVAQQPAPGSLDLVVRLTMSGDDVQLSEPPQGLSPEGESILAANSAMLRVSCSGGADCTRVAVVLGDEEIASISASEESATFQLSGISTGDTLIVSHGDTAVVRTQLQVPDGQSGRVGGGAPTLGELVLNPCVDRPSTTDPPVGYSRENNLMVVRVSPTGAILSAPAENMDENDQMIVHVLADPRLASRLEVKRKSPIRTVGSFNIVGAGTQITRRQSGRLPSQFPPCQDFKFVLRDFASGTGEVEISILDDQGNKKLTNSFDFIVHKLYHGMFSFGALRSDVSDKAFSLAPQGDKKIIVVSEDGGEDTFYSVLFTPFVWGARDIEKEPLAFYHRLNPSFGITLDNYSDNALVGVSLDLGAFVFTGGLHYARVKDLSAESGLKPGDPFEGEATEIPTTKTWERGVFFGVSIDLRAAAQLLQTVVTGGGN